MISVAVILIENLNQKSDKNIQRAPKKIKSKSEKFHLSQDIEKNGNNMRYQTPRKFPRKWSGHRPDLIPRKVEIITEPSKTCVYKFDIV